MRLRWTAAGMLEAERQFRCVVGYRELPLLVAGLRKEVNFEQDAAMVAARSSPGRRRNSTAIGTFPVLLHRSH